MQGIPGGGEINDELIYTHTHTHTHTRTHTHTQTVRKRKLLGRGKMHVQSSFEGRGRVGMMKCNWERVL